MKRITKTLAKVALVLLVSAFFAADGAVLGLMAVGIYAFCYIYDDGFRRIF